MVAVPDSNRTSRGSDVFTVPDGPPTGHDLDTVRLRLDGSFGPDFLHGFDDYTETYGDVGWLSSHGRSRNLVLAVTPSKLSVKGSLASFVSGTNAAPFDHGTLVAGLEELAGDLGLQLSVLLLARVMRLDVGVNVPWSGPVDEVTGALVAVPPERLQPRGPRASTAVGHTTRELYVYDKRAERGRRPVDPVYGDGPLMRVELRYLKKVDRQLKRSVTLGTLCDPSFYGELGRRLEAAADAAPFRRGARPRAARTKTELIDTYAALGLAATGGPHAALSAIETDRRAGRLGDGSAGTKRAYTLRGEVERLRTLDGVAHEVDVASDFRRAVRRALYDSLP